MSNNNEWGIELSGEPERFAPTPQDYGFPENPTRSNIQVWERQQLFLKAYSRLGVIGAAAEAVGITRHCVDEWQRLDKWAFKKRMDYAYQDYRELCERKLVDVLDEKPHNHDILRIFHMKAVWPEKYREEVKVIGADVALRIQEKAEELARRERQQLEGRTMEGEFKELPGLEGQS